MVVDENGAVVTSDPCVVVEECLQGYGPGFLNIQPDGAVNSVTDLCPEVLACLPGPGVIETQADGTVAAVDPCTLVTACLPGPGLVQVADDGTVSAVNVCDLVGECLTGQPGVSLPVAPVGAGPWTLQFDGSALTWV